MPLIIIYDLRKNKAPDKFFPRKSRICQGLKIYFQMFMKKMEEFRLYASADFLLSLAFQCFPAIPSFVRFRMHPRFYGTSFGIRN